MPNYNIDFSEIFHIDETSASGLRWKIDIYSGEHKSRKVASKDALAGSVKNDKSGWKVSYKRNTYLVHRIIWIIANGSVNDCKTIDHIDGNPLNNKLENLRSVSIAENSRNCKIQKNNKSGVTGVFRRINRGVVQYIAFFRENGRAFYKVFSCSKMSEKEAFELAASYRKENIDRLNESGYNYSNRHGK